MKRFLGRRLGGKGGLNQRRLRKPLIESLHERVVYAADMQFVKDINTLPDLVGSSPSEFVQVGTMMYFSATSAATGLELWKTDGTAAGTVLVKDIQDGAYGAGVRNLTNVNGTLFFSADDGIGGYELWKSDGTSAGTALVSDIQRGRRGSSPSNFVALGSTLIFSADDGSNGVELWQSNGTAAGTSLVRNIRTGNVGSNPGNLTTVAGSVYFTADDGANGVELWKSDGTNAGTVLVRNIRAGVASSTPSSLVNVNGTLYFSANDGTNGVELWKSSGTAATTVLVRSIFAGLSSANPSQLTNVGGTLYFAADDGTSGVELWKSDGTNAGTVRVSDIQAGAVGSNPSQFLSVGTTLYFAAQTSTGVELWKSTGTAAGTTLVKDIQLGAGSSAPTGLKNLNGTVFFAANNGVNGVELWKSDGTAAGTVLVRDINASAGVGSNPSQLAVLNGKLLFQANDGLTGSELWQSDGTTLGTTQLKDVLAGNLGSQIGLEMTTVGGNFYFSANDGVTGSELWKSDGTAAGTVLVKDIAIGAGDSAPTFLANVGGVLYFSADDGVNGAELWKSDGTVAGTVLVKDITVGLTASNPAYLTNVNGTLFFTATNGTNGIELWKSDGTAAGTVMVRDINAGGVGSVPTYLTNVNGTLLFVATDLAGGTELWKSNGTTAGTVRVKDIRTGVASGLSARAGLVNVAGTLYFTADNGTNGSELWKSDGTDAGTVMVRDMVPGAGSSYPEGFANVGGVLYFSGTDGVTGYELWKSDGTAAGTILVADSVPGAGGLYPHYITGVNGSIFYQADDGVNGAELWKSDGTAAGTLMLRDINPGLQSSTPSSLVGAAGVVYFKANDGINGPELWQSDGTIAGTVRTTTVTSAPIGVAPSVLANFNNRLVFAAVDDVHGSELWAQVPNVAPTDIQISASVIAENSVAPTAIGDFTSTDPDVGDLFTYTIVAGLGDTDNASFEIVGATLRSRNSFDFETKPSYSVRVRSTDKGGLFTEKAFVISVTNVDEAPTDILLSSTQIAENSGANATVGTLSTIDGDTADTFTYTLVAGTGDVDNAAFAITDNTLAAVNNFDFETKASYTLRIRSTDPVGLFTEKSFVINVTNVNEAPTDIVLSASSISENAGANAAVGTFSTTDVDAANTFTYTLVAGTGDVDNAAFNISGNVLRATNSFDFEAKSTYTVRMRSVDQGGLFTEKVFLINVTNVNEAPTDIGLTSTSILENSGANATVGTLSTVDVDASNTFSYALIAGVGDVDNAAFNISGNILRATSNLSFATKSSYSIRVRSTDQGGLSFDKTFTIQVLQNNSAPTDVNLVPGFVFENAGANASVGALSTTDPNAGNTFTYSLVAGLGDGDNDAFNVLGSSLRANASFDYESRSSYTVRVRSTDQGGLFTEKAFIVNVLNTNEAPTDIILSANQIVEGAIANTTVGLLSTIDVDAANSFTYALVAGAGDADNAAFNISGNALRATSSFDFETKSSYTVRVRTTDQGGLFTEKVFVISVTNVNEAPTDVTVSSTLIAEGAGVNATVGSLGTIDPDAGNTFVYTLVPGVGDVDNAAFNINGTSLRATSNFDFETKSSYTVRVRSTDQDGLFIEKAFVINVTNVNETPTDILLSSALIAENSGANGTVGTLSTSDPDAGNSFTYALVAGTGDVDNAAFNVNGNALRATSNLDFETKASYTVRVRTTDQGGLFTEKAFVITVSDVNEAPTDLSLSSTSIPENSGVNATVGTLSSTDPDVGNTFAYTLVAGTGDADNTAFNISSNVLRATNNLVFATKSVYTVRVRSTDQGGLFAERTFVINVTSVNSAPSDISISSSLIAENLGVNAAVGSLSTIDANAGDTFTYSLVVGTGDVDNAAFNINGNSLRATSSLDFETKSSYTVRVRSTDQGGLFTEKAFVISVGDVNETPTDIVLSSAVIAENAGANGVVGTLSSTDPDVSNTFTYTLVAGAGDVDNAAFNINGTSLRATSSLDFETKSSYTVRVRSTDQGGLFTEKVFVISVGDVNEAPTAVALSSTSIPENSGANATVGTLSSTDPDASNTFVYTLVAGAGDVDNASFNVSGSALRATNNLVFATKSSYTVRVRTTDQGGLFAERSFVINVTSQNAAPSDIALSSSSIFENLGANATVGSLSTTDSNVGDTFTYTLVAGLGDVDNAAFNISGNVLRATSNLDFETKSSYTVRVRSTDQGGLFTEKAFAISVLDAAEDILISGTAGNDTIIANYTGDGVVAQWLVTRNGGVVFSGVVPAGQNLWFDGLAGTDTLQVVGRSIDDTLTLDGLRIAANGAWTRNSNIESVRILGGNGNDLLRVVSGTASFDGGGGSDRVEATAGANTFTLTGNGTGSLNTTLAFTTIESVQGGIDSDRFVFGASGSLTGQVIGGLGIDTIDQAAKTGTITLNLATGILTSTGGIVGIESVLAGINTADTVIGPNVDSLWGITGPNAWNLNGEIAFTGFENLTGGTGVDLFEFLPTGRVIGTLNGGTGADVASFAALATPVQVQVGATPSVTGLIGRYTAVERIDGNGLAGSRLVGANAATAWVVNAAGDVVVSNVTYSAIPAIAGGTAADTVTGPAVATQWTLNGANTGLVTVGAVALAFTGVENLTGSTASDEFIVMPTGTLSGNINGGTGTGVNSVDYSAWSTNVVVNLGVTTSGNATAVSGSMTGIGMVTGGAGNDSLTGRATLATILIGLGGSDVLIGGSQRDLLIGGTGADILQGAAGDDLLISGTTLHDRDRAALLLIFTEWTSTRTFAQRTANIWGNGVGTSANGTTYLNNGAADGITDSVFADTETDLLTGGTNQDWFFAAPGEISDLVTAGATPDRRD